ncbi:hypothetical protein WBK31_15305 [Nonomuraea sp. N2-4H]|uniref:hypothetical protein n=1 Tax=Nonomuraea sp. N2-4H TaxID=3128898 RepID=UPI00324F5678
MMSRQAYVSVYPARTSRTAPGPMPSPAWMDGAATCATVTFRSWTKVALSTTGSTARPPVT